MFFVDKKHKCAGMLRLAGEQRTVVAVYVDVNVGFLQVCLVWLYELVVYIYILPVGSGLNRT